MVKVFSQKSWKTSLRGEFASIKAIIVDANNRMLLVFELLMNRFIGISKYLSIGSYLMMEVFLFLLYDILLDKDKLFNP
jgi:hypothetical protein